MNPLKEKIIKESGSLSVCVNLSKEINNFVSENNFIGVKKIAVLSNFNVKGLAECLKAKAFQRDIYLQTYVGEYGQWQQEIMGNKLAEFKPDMVFILLDLFGFDNDLYYSYHILPNADIQTAIDKNFQEFINLINLLSRKIPAKIIVNNAIELQPPVLGIMDSKLKISWHEIICSFNQNLITYYNVNHQVFIFDINQYLSQIGQETILYDKYFFMADMHLSPKIFPALAQKLIAYMIPLAGKTKKCIVLDLDNIIWGGVAGEDGIGGIKLAPVGPGQEFYLFQKLLLALNKKGVILAINSKNNYEDIKEIFTKHPYMVLKEDSFGAAQINWRNKADNFYQLAKKLNIGLDSMVFIDDDEANQTLIKTTLPQVEVLDMPSDPSLYCQMLLGYPGFNSFEFTIEDQKRSTMYLEQKKRQMLVDASIDINSFLKNLELKISVSPVSELLIPRSAQLTQKTNQFNLTTKRYHEEDIRNFVNSQAEIWTLEVSDKFGDYGVTGLAIINNQPNYWEIDTFLLSCRVLGKRVEEQFLNFLLNELKNQDNKKIVGYYEPTAKNIQVKNFYQLFNFIKIKTIDKSDVWEYDLNNHKFNPLNFIKIIKK